MPAQWWIHLPRDVVLLVLLAQLLASADGRERPRRSAPRPVDPPVPRRPVRAGRGALCGRRPRG